MARKHHLQRQALKVMQAEQAAERARLEAEGQMVEHPDVATLTWAVATVIGFTHPLKPLSAINLVLAVERYLKSMFDPKNWPGHSGDVGTIPADPPVPDPP